MHRGRVFRKPVAKKVFLQKRQPLFMLKLRDSWNQISNKRGKKNYLNNITFLIIHKEKEYSCRIPLPTTHKEGSISNIS